MDRCRPYESKMVSGVSIMDDETHFDNLIGNLEYSEGQTN